MFLARILSRFVLRNTETKSGGMDHLGPLGPMQTSSFAFYITTRITPINSHLPFLL